MRRQAAAALVLVLLWLPASAGRQNQPAAPTFNKDVAPILYANCVSCHRPGELAPMSLLTYDTARPYAPRIKEMVSTRQMPPWFADPQFGDFRNKRGLTNPDPTQEVVFGPQGYNEMFIPFIEVSVDRDDIRYEQLQQLLR